MYMNIILFIIAIVVLIGIYIALDVILFQILYECIDIEHTFLFLNIKRLCLA